MANLITEKQKKAVRIDYLIRVYSVSLLIPVSILGFFLLAYVVPYYVSVAKKDLRVAKQFDAVLSAENKENVGENVSQIVLKTTDQMKVVELYEKAEFLPSTYFNKIINNKNVNIKITKLSFGLDSKNDKLFLVSGIALNRDGLVSFVEDLKNIPEFINVDLPVSDFAKDSDIPFTLNIKLAL